MGTLLLGHVPAVRARRRHRLLRSLLKPHPAAASPGHGDGVVPGEPGGRGRGGDRGRVRRRRRRGLRDPGGGEAQGPAAARLPAARRGLAARRPHRGQLQVDGLGAGAGVRGRVRAPEEGVRDLPRQQEQRGGLHGEEGGQIGQGEQAAARRAAGSSRRPLGRGGSAAKRAPRACEGLVSLPGKAAAGRQWVRWLVLPAEGEVPGKWQVPPVPRWRGVGVRSERAYGDRDRAAVSPRERGET